MSSHLDRVNPNLIVILHYLTKTLWLVLAGVFGLIGYKLYALGVQQTGGAGANLFKLVSFNLTNAGPGLIVMVFALACALVGAARSRVRFGPHGALELRAPHAFIPDDAWRQKQQFKIFHSFSCHIAKNDVNTFALLSSDGEIQLESISWSAVPENVRRSAIAIPREWSAKADPPHRDWTGSIGKWKVRVGTIIIPASDERWYLVSVNTQDPNYQRAISHLETAPLCLFDS